jgi:peptidoglycan-N-acetylglucosamine deacetylase
MLKHRNIVILFILSLIGSIILNTFFSVHWIFYFVLFGLFLSIEFYGAYSIHSDFHLKAICRINTNTQNVALTFDDGPAAQTEKILSVLADFNAKATFFCIGNRIKGKETLLKKIDEQGHIVGNHSYSHGYFFDFKNTFSLVNDLELANTEIRKVIGRSPAFFRPPYGVTKKLNFEVIGWNIRSLDTQLKNKQEILERVKTKLVPGSIILMHDTVNGIELVLKELLVYLKENNYTVVPLDVLLEKKPYA